MNAISASRRQSLRYGACSLDKADRSLPGPPPLVARARSVLLWQVRMLPGGVIPTLLRILIIRGLVSLIIVAIRMVRSSVFVLGLIAVLMMGSVIMAFMRQHDSRG